MMSKLVNGWLVSSKVMSDVLSEHIVNELCNAGEEETRSRAVEQVFRNPGK